MHRAARESQLVLSVATVRRQGCMGGGGIDGHLDVFEAILLEVIHGMAGSASAYVYSVPRDVADA